MKRLLSVSLCVALLVTPLSISAATLTRPLSTGSRGVDVTALQQALISLGYLKVPATGYFGALTRAAVAAYQQASGVEPVGSVGPKTRALLNIIIDKPTAPVSTITPPVTLPTPAPSTQPTPETPTPAPAVIVPVVPTGPDMAPPVITIVGPAAQLPSNTIDTLLAIDTNENANCRWATLPNMITSSMTAFSNTGGIHHTHLFTGLAKGSLYVYYVRCEDARLNMSGDTTVSFSVQAVSARVPGRQISYALHSSQVATVGDAVSVDTALPLLAFVFPLIGALVY